MEKQITIEVGYSGQIKIWVTKLILLPFPGYFCKWRIIMLNEDRYIGSLYPMANSTEMILHADGDLWGEEPNEEEVMNNKPYKLFQKLI